MKRYFPLKDALGLAACSGSQTTSDQAPAIGTPNPASAYCVQQGGKSEIRKNQDGSEYGVCILPDGKEVEEWAYYRANNK